MMGKIGETWKNIGTKRTDAESKLGTVSNDITKAVKNRLKSRFSRDKK